MSENENFKSKAGILGFLSIALIALFLFVGQALISNNVTATNESIENATEVATEDNTSETTEITAEKVLPNDETLEVDIIADPAPTNVD
jgi:hypothetical protein